MSLDTYPTERIESMQSSLAALEAENKALRARVSELEAEAKQAREDEEWARQNQAWVSLSNEGCWAWEDERSIDARTPTVSAAIRALRAKVEGGKR